MDALLDLNPRQFEDLVADYLRSQGFVEVQRVGGAGDLGVDIRCRDVHGRLVVVQCKRYKPEAKIGSPEIQTFFGMVAHHGASRGIFITSSDFTRPAKRLAQERDLELIDGVQIQGFFDAQLKKRKAEEAQQRQRLEVQPRQRVSSRELGEAYRRQKATLAAVERGSSAPASGALPVAPSRKPERPDFSHIGVEPETTKTPKEVPQSLRVFLSLVSPIVMGGSAVGAYHERQEQGLTFWIFTSCILGITGSSLSSDLYARRHPITKDAADNELMLTALGVTQTLLSLAAAVAWEHVRGLAWLLIVLILALVMFDLYASTHWKRFPWGASWMPGWLSIWSPPLGVLFWASAALLAVRYWPL